MHVLEKHKKSAEICINFERSLVLASQALNFVLAIPGILGTGTTIEICGAISSLKIIQTEGKS